MPRSSESPLHSKSTARGRISNRNTKTRSSIAEEVFRKRGPLDKLSATKKKKELLEPSKTTRISSDTIARARNTLQLRKHHWQRNDGNSASDLTAKDRKHLTEDEDDTFKPVTSSEDDDSDGDEHDWLDGSTIIAQYGEGSETEDERAIALVEYLKIPFQEKAHELKRDLCNALASAVDDIRQAHIQVDQNADADRGKAIVYFNNACDKRHVEASHLQAELKDDLACGQAEIRELLVELKQAYDARAQLWVNFDAKIQELTGLQAGVLDQLDDNMSRTVASLDKKFKAMMKEGSAKEKVKLLRGVMGRF